ncbi:MAG TPA: hypothetical protein VL547_16015 [Dinghuibacter sp.]|uniref:hypothetical protein n=1 Tax=Dinghuibacter sp. TaxID=2024697 RepID=UPI002C72F03A|nr:hypothetical protein [Dinghuibacter sp.]HTJ13542.1 hypothetical protein [Dinghuibacter sp.]
MKSAIRPFCLAIALWGAISCQKSSSSKTNGNSGLSTQPAAAASYDHQSGGVYKGSLTGSSGYFEVNLQVARPFLIYQWTTPQGNIDSLFTTSLSNWTSGQAIVKAVFTGSDGSVFWFSVNADGSNPSIDSVYVPSHQGPVYASIGKETSAGLLTVFQGTGTVPGGETSNCSNGIVNLWINSTTGAWAYLGDTGEFGSGPVTLNGNTAQVVATSNSGNTDEGTLTLSADGATMSGTVTSNSCTHTISLTRIF